MDNTDLIWRGSVAEDPQQRSGDELLDQLFRAALFALKGADTSFRHAFEKAPYGLWEFYESLNHGLVFHVFETGLVYEIYKAWIPMAPVGWEVRNSSIKKSADLVVFKNGGEYQYEDAEYIFEAKWWRHGRDELGMASDIEKCRSWKTANKKAAYLLTFWDWDLAHRQKEQESIMRFCDKHEVKPVFFGAFHTDTAQSRRESDELKKAYFALQVLEIGS